MFVQPLALIQNMMKELLQRQFYNVVRWIIIPLIITVMPACNDEDDEDDLIGNWIERSDFEGVPRSDAIVFCIGNCAYVGMGYDGEDRLKDIWEYDVDRNTWLQKADLPGEARNGAVAFATETRGYVGTGYDGINKLGDFWEYDPTTNTWEQKADFGGSARYDAVAFSIDNKGYICSGYDGNYLKDLWQYNPSTDSWEQKVSLGGGKRRDAVAFVINDKGYVCTGIDNGFYENDFWEYDPVEDTWNKKNYISDATEESFDDEYTSITGINKSAFTMNQKGYVVSGGTSSLQEVWEYNPVTDLWEEKTSLEGTGRIDAVGFSVNNRGFITTGRSSSYYFDDIWEFKPDDVYDEYD